jgi:Phage ABA sandwich domain
MYNIDQNIHEKIFGKCWHEYNHKTQYGQKCCGKCLSRQAEFHTYPNLKYSSDISAAWKVIEEMESQGYYLNIIGKCGGNAYYVRFEQSEQKGESVSLSLPTAICQAALSTIEEKLR